MRLTSAAWLAERDAAADKALLAQALELQARGIAIPPEVAAGADWALLADSPSDAARAARIAQLADAAGAATADLHIWALRLHRRDHPHDGKAARHLLRWEAKAGLPLDDALCAAAFSGPPDEGDLSTVLADLDAAGCDGLGEIAERARRAWPASPGALYYACKARVERGRLEEAEHLLAAHADLAPGAPYLAELRWRCLHGLQRDEALTQSIRAFFNGFDGDLWRTDDFAARQTAAVGRGVPAILVVTQPKSGSVFTLNTLTRGLTAPSIQICPKDLWPYDGFVVPECAADFAQGGAVCVEHLRPTPEMLSVLAEAGVRRFVLNLRDVRQAALSWSFHILTPHVAGFSPTRRDEARRREQSDTAFEAGYLEDLAYWAAFQEAWLAYLDGSPAFEILVTDFDEIVDDEAGYLARILAFNAVPDGAFDWSVIQSDPRERAAHFRRGDKREWESDLSEPTRRRIPEVLAPFPKVAAFVAHKDAARL